MCTLPRLKNSLHFPMILFLMFISCAGMAQTFSTVSANQSIIQKENCLVNHSIHNFPTRFGADQTYLIKTDPEQANTSLFSIQPTNQHFIQYPNLLQTSNANRFMLKTTRNNSDWLNTNRRNIYSSLWTFASLNYLYADVVQFMDQKEHLKYHTGKVNGFEMTPGFIAGSAAFMQIAIANVFLPQLIKNDKTLRWIQITSGAIMTMVQGATLFAGKPTPYYAVFSGFEIAATAFITINASKWKIRTN